MQTVAAPDAPSSQRLAGGPLLFPGNPFTFAESCSWTDVFCELDPTVPSRADGPFLLPGAPLMPAPEFCALGAVAAAPADGPEFCVLVPWFAGCCASAGAPIATAAVTSMIAVLRMCFLLSSPAPA